MITDALPHALYATGGMLIIEGGDKPDVKKLCLDRCELPFRFGPERFRIELREILPLEKVIAGFSRVCGEQGADLKRELDSESYQGDQSNVTVVVTCPDGTSFRAMIFVDNRLVDFRPLPTS